ncbi:MAG: putative transporter [Pseudomonadota bacterium]
MNSVLNTLGNLGAFVREHLVGLGYASRMFVTIMRRSAFLLKRPRLVTDQVHFVGNLLYQDYLLALCWVCKVITP